MILCDFPISYIVHVGEVSADRETWEAGVDIHTVDTLSSLFQFRTHFLVRFVPNKLPLPLAQLMVLDDM